MVECKSGEKTVSPHLLYCNELLKPAHAVQLVDDENYSRVYPQMGGAMVLGYERFFSNLVWNYRLALLPVRRNVSYCSSINR